MRAGYQTCQRSGVTHGHGVSLGEALLVEAYAGYALTVLLDVGSDLARGRDVIVYRGRSFQAHDVAAPFVGVQVQADVGVLGYDFQRWWGGRGTIPG